MNSEITASEYLNTLQVKLITGGYFKNISDWESSMSMINFCKFYYILDGECVIGIDDKEFTVGKGQFVLVPAGHNHSYRLTPQKKLEKYWCHFNATMGYSNLFDLFSVPFTVNVGYSKKLIDIFTSMLFETSEDNNISKSIRQRGMLMLLISEYLKKSGYSINNSNDSSTDFIPVINYMNEHISDNIPVEVLSGMLHLHPNYFIRVFKQYFGCSPIKFFNNMRIERAKSQLENTNLSIDSISKNVGCKDIYTFSKFFKSGVGISPSKYRNICRAEKLHLGKE